MAIENLTKGGSVAGDVALQLLGDGDTSQWTPSVGTDHYSLLKKGVISPEVPGITTYLSAAAANKVDRFTIQNTILKDLTDVTVWVYAEAPTDCSIQASIYVGGAWEAYAEIVPEGSAAGWYSKKFSGTWVQADIDALVIGLKNLRPTSGTAKVYAAYVVLTGSNEIDGNVIIATDTTKPTNAALKAQGWHVTATEATQPPSGLPV